MLGTEIQRIRCGDPESFPLSVCQRQPVCICASAHCLRPRIMLGHIRNSRFVASHVGCVLPVTIVLHRTAAIPFDLFQ